MQVEWLAADFGYLSAETADCLSDALAAQSRLHTLDLQFPGGEEDEAGHALLRAGLWLVLASEMSLCAQNTYFANHSAFPGRVRVAQETPPDQEGQAFDAQHSDPFQVPGACSRETSEAAGKRFFPRVIPVPAHTAMPSQVTGCYRAR